MCAMEAINGDIVEANRSPNDLSASANGTETNSWNEWDMHTFRTFSMNKLIQKTAWTKGRTKYDKMLFSFSYERHKYETKHMWVITPWTPLLRLNIILKHILFKEHIFTNNLILFGCKRKRFHFRGTYFKMERRKLQTFVTKPISLIYCVALCVLMRFHIFLSFWTCYQSKWMKRTYSCISFFLFLFSFYLCQTINNMFFFRVFDQFLIFTQIITCETVRVCKPVKEVKIEREEYEDREKRERDDSFGAIHSVQQVHMMSRRIHS